MLSSKLYFWIQRMISGRCAHLMYLVMVPLIEEGGGGRGLFIS